jgi:hypothetical protein
MDVPATRGEDDGDVAAHDAAADDDYALLFVRHEFSTMNAEHMIAARQRAL